MEIKKRFALPAAFLLLLNTSVSVYKHATRVLPTTKDVEDASLATGEPDGRYAGIDYLGNLDMEFFARNMEGDDIAVYARSPFDLRFGTTTYHVFGRRNGGWEYIGTGHGKEESEKFDLGGMEEIDAIRMVFANPYEFFRIPKQWKHQMGVDSVEAIH